jgi:hypothetical protein
MVLTSVIQVSYRLFKLTAQFITRIGSLLFLHPVFGNIRLLIEADKIQPGKYGVAVGHRADNFTRRAPAPPFKLQRSDFVEESTAETPGGRKALEFGSKQQLHGVSGMMGCSWIQR